MAEINDNPGNASGKGHRSPGQKKKSTRIDMTAMVDVAFLLLTFFILTTTLLKTSGMNFALPVKDDGKPVAESKILTLILGADDRVFYYTGFPESGLNTTNFSSNGIRKVISGHLNKFPNRCDKTGGEKNCWDPIVVIKPHKTSNFQNLVDAMDEMLILKAPKYVLDEVQEQDSLLMAGNNLR